MKHRNAHHFTFAPKYRREVLGRAPLAQEIEKHLRHIATYHNMDVIAIAIQRDHVHIFVDLPRKLSPAYAVQQLKWFSSIWTRKAYPGLINEKSLWQRRYYSRSIGGDKRAVQEYIDKQKVEGNYE
jgi:putative transposase